jgi:endoglucanase
MMKSFLHLLLAASVSAVRYGGINIAGFDFGIDIYGNSNGGADASMVTSGGGITQMSHFVSEGLNAFRLPVGWQYLATQPDQLDDQNWMMYDQLVQACVKAGAAMCIVDMYAAKPPPLLTLSLMSLQT